MRFVYDLWVPLTGTENSIVVCISPLTATKKVYTERNKSGIRWRITDRNRYCQKSSSGRYSAIAHHPENLLNNRKYQSMLLSPAYAKNLVAVVVNEGHYVKIW